MSFDAGMAMLIVDGPLVGVSQNLAGFLGFLEALFGFFVIGIAVGVKLHRQASIRLFDFRFGRGFRYVEYLVVITFGHAC